MKLDYLFNDRHFFSQMYKIALPITMQNLVLASLNLVDNIMIGGLGETAIAGVGLANQYFFLLNLLLFGIVSGSSIFTAQFWGTKDIKNIRKVLGICIITGGAGAFLFSIGGLFFPNEILGIFSKDPIVIQLGTQYLRIVLFSYVITAVTFAYSFVLRSIGNAKTPLVVSVIALGTNTVLNYLLINGYMGFPRMGVAGAAVATVIARALEMVMLLWIVYSKQDVTAASIREMTDLTAGFVKQFFKVTVPVILNESMWALGVTMYAIAYARMGTEVIASINITSTIERIVWVVFMGFGSACAVMIGNQIGSGDDKQVFLYAKRFAIIGPAAAILTGIFVILISRWMLIPYKVSPIVLDYAHKNIIVFCLFMWAKVFNYINIVGILRSGGDTTFCLLLDTCGVWLVGVPLAFLGGLVFHLPIYWVYALVQVEEVIKLIIGIPRLASKKWINNLTTEMK
ncbi:MAG: MATE family efflux transporter [Clostridia bacterium BRH_c25]|nr:MAG: MATE family efflux transporter [Clostridia bacterium BRH_c25]